MIVRNYQFEGKNKKALLVNPPVYEFDNYSPKWSQPAGLLRIATALKKRGYRICLIDCLQEAWQTKVKPRKVFRVGDEVLLQKHFGLGFEELAQRLYSLEFAPDEVYVTSIMTYWWESTRDVVALVKQVFPGAQVLVGGIYPTLCPQHAESNLQADVIVQGEIYEASMEWTDLSLYAQPPSYALINPSRGCPFDCAYCAQRAINGVGLRFRQAEDVVAEIEYKNKAYGVQDFFIFADNFLVDKSDVFARILELVLSKGLGITLNAPKGMEARLLKNQDLLKMMRRAGWTQINMGFESASPDQRRKWDRFVNSNEDVALAVEACARAGYRLCTDDIVGFVLYATPEENLEDVLNTILFLHNLKVFSKPMPFTPVPGTKLFSRYEWYLRQKDLKLEDLYENFYPFSELNQVPPATYQAIKGIMLELNQRLKRHQVLSPEEFAERFDLCAWPEYRSKLCLC